MAAGTGRAVIALALSMDADRILIDERKGSPVAIAKGFTVTGPLGILRLAAQGRLIDAADTSAGLMRVNFQAHDRPVPVSAAGGRAAGT